jgi:hypothetical protein
MSPEITKRPFGFDAIENEEYVKKHGKEETKCVYVDMIVDYKPTGQMIPISFIWEDGREYSVGKVINVRQGHSLKAFTSGLHYLCQKGMRRYYVYFDGERWYMEVKQGL